MTKTEIRNFLDKISHDNILKAFNVLNENYDASQSLIKQYVIRYEGKTYPPPETLRIAYENATGDKLPVNFFDNIGEGSEQFKFIREKSFELNRKEGRFPFYIKRLLENELGYRKGLPTTSETFMISKEAAWNFFPPLGIQNKNETKSLLFSKKDNEEFYSLNYTYYNDKYFGGSRNEYRIYLTTDLLLNFRKFKPSDLVIIVQKSNNNNNNEYELMHIKKGDNNYDYFDRLLGDENHLLSDNVTTDNMNEEINNYPLNQILFGPPGTGKTYTTIIKALNILGLLEVKETYTIEEYENAQKVFKNELGKRIEFVTMHQSFSYEDFVEGLKPVLGDGNGISFDYKNGVFKEICSRAEESTLLINRIGTEETILIDKLFPSFFLSIDEKSVIEILSEKKYQGKKITQKNAFEYFNEKLGKKYCKAWRDKFDYVLGEKSPRVGYQAHQFRDGELEEFIEHVNFFEQLSPDQRKEKLIEEWILEKPKTINPKNDSNNFVIILDEINRANISRVFGELIALVEKDKRDGKLTVKLPSGDSFSVPSNLYIIGTMNTADKSIALVDIALRRRFKFIPLYPDLKRLKSVLNENKFDPKKIETRVKLLTNLNKIIRAKKSVDFEIGHSYFMEKDELIDILNDQILPLLNEYFMYNLSMVKDIIEKQQKDNEGNNIPKLGIKLNEQIWKERGLLEVESVDSLLEQIEADVNSTTNITTELNNIDSNI